MTLDVPVCPVCHSPFMIGCNWYGPAPDHHIYTLCARCDLKAADEPYRSLVISTLDKLEAERKDSSRKEEKQ